MRYILISLCLLAFSITAHAAEPVPGDPCSPAGATVAGADGTGGHFMICQGGAWKSVYSYNASGALTKLGNQNCASGEILKWNGTSWACAADNAGLTALPVLSSANIWVGNTANTATATSLSGDATLSNTGILTISSGAVGSTEIADGSITNADLAGSISIAKLAVPGGTSNFLREDGTWVAPTSSGGGATGTTCGIAVSRDQVACGPPCPSGVVYDSIALCEGSSIVSGCPGGYTLRTFVSGRGDSCAPDAYKHTCMRICTKN